jgi:hypothetical protein
LAELARRLRCGPSSARVEQVDVAAANARAPHAPARARIAF